MTDLPTPEQFAELVAKCIGKNCDDDAINTAYSAALTRIEELEAEALGQGNIVVAAMGRATAAEQRVAKLQNTLTRLEWSGKAAKAPYSMGGPTAGYLPCCPVCRGINPEARWKGEFIASAVGHRELCDMKYQLRGGPAGDAI